MNALVNVTPRAIRNARQPLTLEQIQSAAPSAFAEEPYHAMSSRYAYIPTSHVIRGMMDAGFQPFAAMQSRTSIEDRKTHTKHMIRFRMPHDASIQRMVGDVFPEIVLVNSHDGTSAYKLMAGMFRLVCGNGMIIADSMIASLSIRHSGNVIEEAARGSIQLVEKMPEAIDTVSRWRNLQLTSGEQTALAEAAHVVRFADSEGKIDTPIQPAQLLQVRRWDDKGNDLWSTFNRVQENVIKGGLSARKPGSYQRTSSRAVKGIDQDVRLNRALWTLGERMAELKTVAVN